MPKSIVSLARAENLSATLNQAIAGLGELPDLNGKKVLIKPNVNSNDPFPATSNPQLVRLLINKVKERNPSEIIIGDSSNASYLPTVESMKQTGLYDAINDIGVTILSLEDFDWVELKISEAINWKQMKVSKILTQVDYFINQCNIKTHFLANYSMALKNMMGLVNHRSRMSMHLSPRYKFWQMIAEISLARMPDLIIADATMAMVTGGPFSGDIRETGIVAASNNAVALDAVGLAILKTVGTTSQIADISVWEQPVLKRAIELGIGPSSREEVELVQKGIIEIGQIKANLYAAGKEAAA